MAYYTLGISAFYHDSAAVLLKNNIIVAAFQEERFTRVRHDRCFPINAIKNCIKQGNISFDQIDLICYYEDPEEKFKRIIKSYVKYFPKKLISFLFLLPGFIKKQKILSHVSKQLAVNFGKIPKKIIAGNHHLSHAASAFYASPFSEAAVLCIDGVGEWATISAWYGKDAAIQPLWQINFPHSLGLLYSAFTQFCGFKVDSGEYKLMGLAPYGVPKYQKLIFEHLINLSEDGSFTLNMQFFDYEVGDSMINKNFEQLFGGKSRNPESEITQREMDIAASIQAVTEQVLLKLASRIYKETHLAKLCLAGGVALNCVANGKLVKSKIFEDIWVQPASGDAGGALGAAYLGYYQHYPSRTISGKVTEDAMQGAYLGNSYTNLEIKSVLDSFGASYSYSDEDELLLKTGELLQAEKVVGWFQGRMEFGPRALGGRSILGNPKSENMQSVMNIKIKNRESFRPFAPAIMVEHTPDWFKLDCRSPYMLIVAEVEENCKKETSQQESGLDKLKIIRSTIPAVTHVDYSARIQTVDGKYNSRFYKLLQRFYDLTSCPMLINTSFNVRGEPIVESPVDAYQCFMRTAMDYLVIGNYILDKKDQPKWVEHEDWRAIYVD